MLSNTIVGHSSVVVLEIREFEFIAAYTVLVSNLSSENSLPLVQKWGDVVANDVQPDHASALTKSRSHSMDLT